ncbi:hypothetical protein NHX12_034495 [Muraenolepis orangiensis]|uniref:Uncharacterized protein n=1 Tax=Muraenolepis orangiensis TaxID=630683 RepID=A0A9Q0D6V5_9TELE|nr:hypothetical protein NHX12_034495 [Muraenolepis orangiensis]
MSADRSPQFGASAARGRQSPRKAPSPRLLAYILPAKPRQKGPVTLDHVKRKSEALDHFLWAELLYVSCFLELRAVQSGPRPLLAEQSVSGEEEEAMAKVELARNKMAACYAALLLGLSAPQHHHLACGR